MKPNLKSTLLATAAGLALTLNSVGAAETYEIDSEKSEVAFTIMNKPPGADKAGEVPGKFTAFRGTVVFDAEDASKISIEVEIDAASVDTANPKRDDHLKNQDFFKVKEHPKLTFKSSRVEANADGTYAVEGDFTLLGVTKPISLVLKKEGESTASTTFQIKRSEYGMTYRVPDTGDEVNVSIRLVGKKQ